MHDRYALMIYDTRYGACLHGIKNEELVNPHYVNNPPGVTRLVHDSCVGEEYILPAYAVGLLGNSGAWIDVGLNYAQELGFGLGHLRNARPNDRTITPLYIKRSYLRRQKR